MLEKFYKMDKESVCDNIEYILNTPNIKTAEKNTLLKALEVYRYYNMDFIDSYNYAYFSEEESDTILSYDRHFDRIKAIRRIEP